MALKVVDAGSATVANIVAVVYGAPGMGKSSFLFSADKPIDFDFDAGAHRAANRSGKGLVQVSAWADVADTETDDLAPYNTVGIDTVGTALDTLAQKLWDADVKNRNGLQLSMNGYGKLAGEFQAFVRKIRMARKDLVFVAHMEESEKNGKTTERIIATGKSKQLIYGAADVMGRLMVAESGERVFDCRPTSTSFGKDPGIGTWTVHAPEKAPKSMGDMLHAVKKILNDKAEESREEQERLEALRETYSHYTKVAQFNSTIERMVETDATPVERKILVDAGKAKGFTFNPETRRFDAPAEAETF